jgi:hypothetical protein
MQTPFAISTFANGRWGNQHLQTHLGNRLLKPPWEIDFENRPPLQTEGAIAEIIIFIFSSFSFVGPCTGISEQVHPPPVFIFSYAICIHSPCRKKM